MKTNYIYLFEKKKYKNNYKSRPFLKWAGGKRQLIPQLKNFIPKNFNNYIEPFVGGGALFFYLFDKDLIRKKAILIDNNEELINCYNVIKNNADNLIVTLSKHKNEKDYYYKIRNINRDPLKYKNLSKIERASRTIFLNKCCYNGLYRVNSKGQFNVPFGRYKNPNFCDEENLRAVNKTLQDVKIIHGSFEICLNFAQKNDFIYLDPPYHPLSETSSFTSYTKEDFGLDSQKKLFEVFKKLDKMGNILMLSNSNSKFIRELYKEYNIIKISAKRAINSNGAKRGSIKELLILNKWHNKSNITQFI